MSEGNVEVSVMTWIGYEEKLVLKPLLCKAQVIRTLKKMGSDLEGFDIPEKVVVYPRPSEHRVYLKVRTPFNGASKKDTVLDFDDRDAITDIVHGMLWDIGVAIDRGE